MRFTRLVSTPDGSVSMTDAMLARPLEGCPGKTTYRAYFEAMEAWLCEDGGAVLFAAASALLRRPVSPADVKDILLCSEKHGAWYHPARLELVLVDGGRAVFCLLAASALPGFLAMEEEYLLLKRLGEEGRGNVLPRVFAQADRSDWEGRGDWAFMLAEWLTGHHEFHINENDRLLLWDYDAGFRPLSRKQAREVFERIASIAAAFFDPATGRRVHPWHHAAGDFIVSATDAAVSVKLSTARGFDPIGTDGLPDRGDHVLRATLAFFLDLALRIRLDRRNGTGETVFMDDEVLKAALSGFFPVIDEVLGDRAAAFAALAASLSPGDIETGSAGRQADFGAADRAVIRANIRDHARTLAELLKSRRRA